MRKKVAGLGLAALFVVFALTPLLAQFVDYSKRSTTSVFRSIILAGTARGEVTGPEITRASATAIQVPGLTVPSGGVVTLTGTTITRASQEYQLGFNSAKVGGTAGWVVAAAANLYEFTLPASQTGSKLIIPVSGLRVGDTITAFKIEAQIESAGGTVTLDADLRKLTNVAADPTDASVGAITQVSVTADTKSEPTKTALAEVVAADERFYIVVTATTAASTDIRLLGATVTVTTA
jgi:hypothetical protein